MKQLIGNDWGSYSFSPLTRQVIIVTGDSSILTLDQILAVTNVTRNTLIYNFLDATLGGTISNNVLTLTYNTTSMSASDILQIYIDANDRQEEILQLLKKQLKLQESLSNVDTSNRLRVAIDASPSLTVTAVTSITNPISVSDIATIGGLSPVGNYRDTSRIAYNQGIRAFLTWS